MTHEEAIEYISERYVTMSMCLTLDECRKHNKAISMAIDALEKQIPKKPTNLAINTDRGYTIYDCECPSCEQSHRELFPFAFCIHCGQALEWEK